MKRQQLNHPALVFLILQLLHPAVFANIDLESFKTTITTGAFYTDQSGIVGTVTPWRLVVEFKQQMTPKTEISVKMNSQTGITSGPYIDGFNTQPENFRVENIKYTQIVTNSITSRLGLGKLKANILKQGGSSTPMPFSQAMGRLPLTASDIAWGVQKIPSKFNGSYSIGTAISDISTQTKPESRTYSLFMEAYRKTARGSVWTQYSQNNLVQTLNSNHYFSFGSDTTRKNTTTNATVYIGTIKGFIGFDCGIKKRNIQSLFNADLGVGYGVSKDKQSTVEISLQKKLGKIVDATASWYLQNPDNAKQFNVAGIKLEHKF